MTLRRLPSLCLSLILFVCFALPAAADDLIAYQVRPGDTLYDLSSRYLASPGDWRLLARINKVNDPTRLVPGSTLMLPASRLLGTPGSAVVVYARGAVDGSDPPAASTKRLVAGDALPEGTAVQVGPGSFATLRLQDGSLLHLDAGTRFTLQRLREVPGLQQRSTVIRLDRGRVDSTVSPQRPGSRFDVRTPLAVAGVRGTRFGVSVSPDGRKTLSDVAEGQVAVTAEGSQDEAALEAGRGVVVSQGAHGSPPRTELRTLLPPVTLALPDAAYERLPLSLPISPIAGADSYRVQIGEDRGFAKVVFSDTATALPLSIAQLPDGTYFLNVRAADADGLLGAESVGSFRVKTTPVPPLAQSPVPGQVFAPGAVHLRCTEVPGAVEYVLQVSRHAGFEQPLMAQMSSAGGCGFELSLPEPGEYHWRVATVSRNAQGAEDRGPFGDASHFVVRALPVAPAPRAAGGDPTEIHWSGEPGERYQVQVAADLGFTEIVRDFETSEARARLDVPAGCRPYFVRLRTLGEHGLQSPFSPPRQVSAATGVCSSDGKPVGVGHGGALGRRSR